MKLGGYLQKTHKAPKLNFAELCKVNFSTVLGNTDFFKGSTGMQQHGYTK